MRRYSEEKHQSLWGAVCHFMEEAGCPINEREASPEWVNKVIGQSVLKKPMITGYEFYCSNGSGLSVSARQSGNGVWFVHHVRINVEEGEVCE